MPTNLTPKSPDVVGPIYAYRAWNLEYYRSKLRGSVGWRLMSHYNSAIWPARKPLVSRPSAPTLHNSCGIYAVDTPTRMLSGTAYGIVALWGKVVVGETGFRASRAFPAAIVAGSEYLRGGLQDYGVPVFAPEELAQGYGSKYRENLAVVLATKLGIEIRKEGSIGESFRGRLPEGQSFHPGI